MDEDELQSAEDLMDEVVNWVLNNEFFERTKTFDKPIVFSHCWKQLPIEVSDGDTWARATAPGVEDSVTVTLVEKFQIVEELYFAISNYAPESVEDRVSAKIGSIHRKVLESRNVTKLGHDLIKFVNHDEPEETPDFVRSRMISHFYNIVYARWASLSRRYVLTEALFHCYQIGLFPFGWDYRKIWCIDPQKLNQ